MEDRSINSRKLKPPSEQRFNEEIDQISALIAEKEGEKKRHFSEEKGILHETNSLKKLKDQVPQQMKQIDKQLQELRKVSDEKRETLGHIRNDLRSKHPERLNASIQNLQKQLKSPHHKDRQKKEIEAEILKLEKAKSSLTKFNLLKTELDEVNERKDRLRKDRDELQQKRTAIQLKLDDLSKIISEKRKLTDEIKKELDNLYDLRRQKQNEFRQKKQQYREQMQEKLKLEEKRREEEREARKKDREELQASLEPYYEEQQLCSALLSYLHKLHTPVSSSLETPSTPYTPATTPSTPLPEGCTILKKKDEDMDMMFGGSKTGKKSRRERKSKKERALTHTAEAFAQFASLDLNAPARNAEILTVIEQLKAKQKLFQKQAAHEKLHWKQSSSQAIGSKNASLELDIPSLVVEHSCNSSGIADTIASEAVVKLPDEEPGKDVIKHASVIIEETAETTAEELKNKEESGKVEETTLDKHPDVIASEAAARLPDEEPGKDVTEHASEIIEEAADTTSEKLKNKEESWKVEEIKVDKQMDDETVINGINIAPTLYTETDVTVKKKPLSSHKVTSNLPVASESLPNSINESVNDVSVLNSNHCDYNGSCTFVNGVSGDHNDRFETDESFHMIKTSPSMNETLTNCH